MQPSGKQASLYLKVVLNETESYFSYDIDFHFEFFCYFVQVLFTVFLDLKYFFVVVHTDLNVVLLFELCFMYALYKHNK